MSANIRNFILLVVFAGLSAITTHAMWSYYEWRVIPYIILILSIVVVGENIVSSQGYYHYTRQAVNGPFVRNMPIWIMFLWIFSVQASLLIAIFMGLNGVSAILFSGWFSLTVDFLFLEPFMSRRKELWRWTPVENGYFEFIPDRMNRFTAPPGNYVAWFVFPFLANCFLAVLMLLF